MLLLHTSSVRLEEFTDAKHVPQYAILSHRWEKGEVLFADVAPNVDIQKTEQKEGYSKVAYSCRQAAKDGFEYIWIDTCCIDKSSSAELSESINSMYAWYQKAQICYAYLSDVPNDSNPTTDPIFAKSAWFTRGWTLQELIAPTEIVFYSQNWTNLGEKLGLCETLFNITGIDATVLVGTVQPWLVIGAKRMSWAAKGETTRAEDRAYSLMGLFGINMPLIYGEGDKAFIRLQEEIMKSSDDHSLFAWKDETASPKWHYGLLARDPKFFEHSGRDFSYGDWEPRSTFSMTNRGLRISLPISRADITQSVERQVEQELFIAALNCPKPFRTDGFTAVYLKKLTYFNETMYKNQYVRVHANQLLSLDNADQRGHNRSLYVRQNNVASAFDLLLRGRPPSQTYTSKPKPGKGSSQARILNQVTRLEHLDRSSATIDCAHCNKRTLTRAAKVTSKSQIRAIKGGLFLTPGLASILLISIRSWCDVDHYCTSCNTIVARK